MNFTIFLLKCNGLLHHPIAIDVCETALLIHRERKFKNSTSGCSPSAQFWNFLTLTFNPIVMQSLDAIEIGYCQRSMNFVSHR